MTTRPTWRSALIIVATAAVLGVYLFVQAPAPLAATTESSSEQIPIGSVLAILEHENATARALWTEDIVNAGKSQGLAFDERWLESTVHAGPLPALFLRETARRLERAAPGLRLFLGSPHPINTANQFAGRQAEHFAQLAAAGAPQFFVEPDTGLQTAMFADRAIVEACAKCHNEHAESPKKDWKRGDIMGATTWMYPSPHVSAARALQLIGALRQSIRDSYEAYLAKAATFPTAPPIGTSWPSSGYQLPSSDAFMQELAARSSARTLLGLLGRAVPAVVVDPAHAPTRPSTPPPVAAPGSPASAAAPAADRPADTLVIRANKRTRVTVEHAGVRLVVSRLRAGTVTTIASPPPLRVRVGDADAVSLDYRGKAIPAKGANEVEIVVEEEEE